MSFTVGPRLSTTRDGRICGVGERENLFCAGAAMATIIAGGRAGPAGDYSLGDRR